MTQYIESGKIMDTRYFVDETRSAVFRFQLYREMQDYPLTPPLNLYTPSIRNDNVFASLQTVMYSYHISSCVDPEKGGGAGGPGPSLKNHKHIRFLCNTDPVPLNKPDSMLCHHRHASETLFKWRFACWSIMGRLW